jgi:hypothetical protein
LVGTGRFELPTPRTPSDFRRIDADCDCLLNLTTVISLREPWNPTELLLKYAIFYLESPQKSPQSLINCSGSVNVSVHRPDQVHRLIHWAKPAKLQKQPQACPSERLLGTGPPSLALKIDPCALDLTGVPLLTIGWAYPQRFATETSVTSMFRGFT